MESLKEIFRIGKGPSSSHTMGPQRAAIIFAERHSEASRFEVTVYGSLAATGAIGFNTSIIALSVMCPLPVAAKLPYNVTSKRDASE